MLAAAGMHAAWNVLLKGAPDPLRLAQRALVVGVVAFAPLTAVLWLLNGRPGLPPAAWGLAGLSGLAELGYFVFLSRAYRAGELSFVYPIARGTGPLVAVAGGLVLLREQLGVLQLAGVAVMVVGMWMVRRPSLAGGPLAAALLTGLFIGTYTVIDRVGVRLGPPWLYAWVVFVMTAIALAAAVALRGDAGGEVPAWRTTIAVGVMMNATYYVVLLALALAPVSIVAPARESAIVLVSAWSVLRLREREGAALKLAGAGAIVAGIVLLVL